MLNMGQFVQKVNVSAAFNQALAPITCSFDLKASSKKQASSRLCIGFRAAKAYIHFIDPRRVTL